MTVVDDAQPSWRLRALEVAAGFVVALLFVWSCSNIRVDPMQRFGQVSGIAAVELRLLLFGVPLIVALILASRIRGGRGFALATRFVCSALAGLSSAAIAGGILMILARTRYGLGADLGDVGALSRWAELASIGEKPSGLYPPGQVDLIVWISDLFSMPSVYAIKWSQIGGVAVCGPLAYASWRLLLRPAWALGIGVVATLGLVEAYRPFPMLVLMIFIPLALKFLDVLRRSADLTRTEVTRAAVLFGLGFGAAFMMYSGWFQWCAPGFVLAAAWLFPWRRWQNGAWLCGLALVVFGVFSASYIAEIAKAPPLEDRFFYFDVTVEPAYIAMWRGGLPGDPGVWPPLGEMGGVGLFTLLLAIGVGVAIAYGRSHTSVVGMSLITAGAWVFRYWYAHRMAATKLVQLYPRTTAVLLYCAVLLTLYAVYFVVERMRSRAPADFVLYSRYAPIGVCTGFLVLAMSTSSTTIDKYVPQDKVEHPGQLALVALTTPMRHQSQTRGATVDVSSSYDDHGYTSAALVDGKARTTWSSQLGIKHDHEEWVVLKLKGPRLFSKVKLTPAADGFPVELSIDLWDGSGWQPRVFKTDFPQPREPEVYYFPKLEATTLVRVHARKLRKVGDDYVFRLAEIELFY